MGPSSTSELRDGKQQSELGVVGVVTIQSPAGRGDRRAATLVVAFLNSFPGVRQRFSPTDGLLARQKGNQIDKLIGSELLHQAVGHCALRLSRLLFNLGFGQLVL